jgi:hypothetical protein
MPLNRILYNNKVIKLSDIIVVKFNINIKKDKANN